MRLRWMVLGGLLLNVVGLAAQAAEPAGTPTEPAEASLMQARNKFIEDFHRIGLNTTPGDAGFLRIMVEASGAKRGLEIGAATGYGAMLMGLGFERNGGHLTTIDIDPEMVKTARNNLAQMRLQKVVTVAEGDALEVIPKLPGMFDFVFFDAVKRDYIKYLKAVEPKLQPGAVIVADNVIRSASQMQPFLEAIQDGRKYHTVIIRASEEKHDGMSVSYKLK